MKPGTLAITGGTGFVGAHLLRIATERGWQIKALARRPQTAADGIEWIAGSLDDAAALARLVAGTVAVIHVAGIINAPDKAGFVKGNITGTEAIIAAAQDAGVRRFVHVSSLAAREPDLSVYGWSKLVSEQRVRLAAAQRGLDFTVVRPAGIYGPGDREILEFFRFARHGIVPLPPAGRLSVIAVEDLCRLLLDLIDEPATIHKTYEPDDGRPEGYAHTEFAHMLGVAVGRRVRPIAIPERILRLASVADRLVRRAGAKLTIDRVRYFSHPDWVAGPHARPPAEVWHPQIDTPTGLANTAAWYREQGWLKR